MNQAVLLSAAIALILSRQTAFASDLRLIREVESLRNSLKINDPARSNLTLRLADMLFDYINELNKKPDPSPAELEEMRKLRIRAVALYNEHKPANGTLRTKILFQLGRLYTDLGEEAKAKASWDSLSEQSDLRDIQREAVLRLAEYHEKDSTPESQALTDKYYLKAIELCGKSDACYYPHYRRAWLFHKRGQHEQAIQELNLSLWDSKGQAREEVLRDLVLFLSTGGDNGETALQAMEDLADKLSRPALLVDLSEAYYAAGNKAAGTRVLEVVNSRAPTLKHQVRLLEEFYGARRWDDYRQLLDTVERKESVSANESERILKRLTIQLDGERVSQPQHAEDFRSTVLLYLALFPRTESRAKMIEGWCAAETNVDSKLERLKDWIAEAKSGSHREEEISLRQFRAAIAQKEKRHTIVAEEMAELGSDRKYRYHRARALYELRELGQALPIFQELADRPDEWGIQSQNLALDILNQRKDYAGLIQQAALWTGNPGHQKNPALAKELADMTKVSEQASFEQATLAGETPEALQAFHDFCLAGKFLPQACANAKVLASKLKNESVLLSVLKITGAKSELAAEYEAAGYFSDAAKLLEETSKQFSERLKVSLLYELDRKNSDRDRVLKELEKSTERTRMSASEEALLIGALTDASMLSPALLSRPLSEETRGRVAHELETLGKGNEQTRKTLLSSKTSLGPAWSKAVLNELSQLDQAQSKIHFFGKKSQTRFQMRLDALKKLSQSGDQYLSGATAKTRSEIAQLLSESHKNLGEEILSSPMPDGLAPEDVAQVQASLREMAEPFIKKSENYSQIAKEQSEKAAQGVDQITQNTAAPSAEASEKVRTDALDALHRDPSNIDALKKLQAYHSARGETRLAFYFEGRTQ